MFKFVHFYFFVINQFCFIICLFKLNSQMNFILDLFYFYLGNLIISLLDLIIQIKFYQMFIFVQFYFFLINQFCFIICLFHFISQIKFDLIIFLI